MFAEKVGSWPQSFITDECFFANEKVSFNRTLNLKL